MIYFKRILSLAFSLLFVCGALVPFMTPNVHASKDKITVMLDPGHAYGDGGGTYSGTHPECYYNMIIALACKEALEAHGGFEVYLSHPDNNTQATLLERGMAADKVNADVIVSIHIDGNAVTEINGASAMYSVLDKYALPGLARGLLANVTAATGLGNRGTYRRKDTGDGKHVYYWDPIAQWDVPDDASVGPLSDYYGVITWGAKFGIPAVILEHGFLTNEADRAIIENEANLKRMGQADAKAIIEFYTGHTHEWETTRSVDYPTNCVFRGKESYHCRICKARYGTVMLDDDPKDAKHYYTVTDHRARTCTVTGYTTYTCRIAANLTDKGYDVGQHTYTVHNYASGHTYTIIESKEATHTENGVHTERCTTCGNVQTTVTPAEGHSWKELVHTPAQCETDGYLHEKCMECGEERETVLKALEHSYITVENTFPTCTEDGVLHQVCERCQTEYSVARTAEGHTMVDGTYTAPACENDGARIRYCSNQCGYEETDILPALGHIYVEDEILLAPTFFKSGLKRLVCQNDNAHETSVVLPRTAKTWQLVLLFGGTPLLLIALLLLILFLVKKKRSAKSATAETTSENKTDAQTAQEESETVQTKTEEIAEIQTEAQSTNTTESAISDLDESLPKDSTSTPDAIETAVHPAIISETATEEAPAEATECIPMEELDLTRTGTDAKETVETKEALEVVELTTEEIDVTGNKKT